MIWATARHWWRSGVELASGIMSGIGLSVGIWVASLLACHAVVTGLRRYAGGLVGRGDSARANRLGDWVLPAGTLLSLVVFLVLDVLTK